MKSTRPSVVILGAGLMGRWHAHYARAAGARIVAVVDKSGDRAEKLAATCSAAAFEDTRACLSKFPGKIVHICTPDQEHEASLDAALQFQSNILIEKPVCRTIEQASHFFGIAERQLLTICPVHQFPFQDGFLELLERRAELGDIVKAGFTTCSAGGERKSSEERREIMLGILAHPFSLFTRLVPNGLSEAAFEYCTVTDDDLEAHGRAGEIQLSVSVSLRGRPTRNELVVIGERGSALVDLFHGYAVFEFGHPSRMDKMMRPFKYGTSLVAHAGANLVKRAVAVEPAYPGLGTLIERFYQALSSGGQPPISKAETLASLRLADKIRSLKSQHQSASS